jgi:hypothetical protein
VKPEPVAVKWKPIGPPLGLIDSAGVVTVNVAETTVAELASVAATVFAPVGAAAGTANVQAKEPAAEVVMVPPATVPTVQPMNELITMEPNFIVTDPP